MKIQTWLTYSGPQKEVVVGESLTEPNQVMSPREIIQRYTEGREVPEFEGTYSDLDLPDPRTLDLVDLRDLADQYREHNKAVQAEIKARKQRSSKGQGEASDVRQRRT